MKIILITNYNNLHQSSFWSRFIREGNDVDFTMLCTEQLPEYRSKMGYKSEGDFCIIDSLSKGERELSQIFNDTDFVILGSCADKRIYRLLNKSKNLILMNEHILREKKIRNLLFLFYYFHKVKKSFNKANLYALCNSSYFGKECRFFGFKKENIFKFGYFPDVCIEDFTSPRDNEFLYAGRFIKCKNVDFLLDYLIISKSEKQTKLVGNGPLLKKISNKILKYNIKNININGFAEHNELLKLMRRSNVFCFMSDKREGWGVTLYEALSSGCLVVASTLAGSTNYLVKDGFNGVIFNGSKKDFIKKMAYVETLDEAEKNSMRANAIKTIKNKWSLDIASSRLYVLLHHIKSGNIKSPFLNGPLSLDIGKDNFND